MLFIWANNAYRQTHTPLHASTDRLHCQDGCQLCKSNYLSRCPTLLSCTSFSAHLNSCSLDFSKIKRSLGPDLASSWRGV